MHWINAMCRVRELVGGLGDICSVTAKSIGTTEGVDMMPRLALMGAVALAAAGLGLAGSVDPTAVMVSMVTRTISMDTTVMELLGMGVGLGEGGPLPGPTLPPLLLGGDYIEFGDDCCKGTVLNALWSVCVVATGLEMLLPEPAPLALKVGGGPCAGELGVEITTTVSIELLDGFGAAGA